MPRSKRGSFLPRSKIVVTACTDLWSYIVRNRQQWPDFYSYLQHQWRADYFPRISITDINFVTFSKLEGIQLDSCTTPCVLDIAVHCSRGSFYANSYCASITRRNVYLTSTGLDQVPGKPVTDRRKRMAFPSIGTIPRKYQRPARLSRFNKKAVSNQVHRRSALLFLRHK